VKGTAGNVIGLAQILGRFRVESAISKKRYDRRQLRMLRMRVPVNPLSSPGSEQNSSHLQIIVAGVAGNQACNQPNLRVTMYRREVPKTDVSNRSKARLSIRSPHGAGCSVGVRSETTPSFGASTILGRWIVKVEPRSGSLSTVVRDSISSRLAVVEIYSITSSGVRSPSAFAVLRSFEGRS
jgi:hypothetical protein